MRTLSTRRRFAARKPIELQIFSTRGKVGTKFYHRYTEVNVQKRNSPWHVARNEHFLAPYLKFILSPMLSMRSKRFRLISEQTKRDHGRGFSVLIAREIKLEPPPPSFTCAIFRAVFDSCSSFFALKPHRNACYAGYQKTGHTALVWAQVTEAHCLCHLRVS